MAKRKRSTHQYAGDLGWTAEWVWDDDADHSWCDIQGEHNHEVYGCVVKDRRGAVLTSLWGIFDPDHAYAQQIERELITEAFAEMQRALLEVI